MWTYLAQIVNFLVFVAILYFLLYKPVGRMIKARRDQMEAERRDAEKKLAEAETLRAEAEQAAKELEEKRDAVLKEAREQAETQSKERLDQAEEQGRERLERFRRIMQQERTDLLDAVGAELRDTIVKVAGAVLGDAADLADRGIERVEALLAELSDEQRESARQALAAPDARIEVTAAAKLTDPQLDRLKKAVGEALDLEDLAVAAKEDPALLAGLELTLGHVRLEAHWRGVIDDALKQEQPGT